MPTPAPSCSNCAFWLAVAGAPNAGGACRFNAPAPMVVRKGENSQDQFVVRWPLVGPYDWCGDYKKAS